MKKFQRTARSGNTANVTADEKWDMDDEDRRERPKTPYFDGGKPDTWEEALRKAKSY